MNEWLSLRTPCRLHSPTRGTVVPLATYCHHKECPTAPTTPTWNHKSPIAPLSTRDPRPHGPHGVIRPSSNPDRDPDDNWIEFLTGFDPTDPSQWFQLTIINKTGSEATLQLNKVIPNRTYTIQAGTDLLSFPDTVDTLNPSIQEFDITVTDTNATEQKLFYRVEITRP